MGKKLQPNQLNAPGGASVVMQAVIDVPADDWKVGRANPIVLVLAPGVGKITDVLNVIQIQTQGATDFDGEATFFVRYADVGDGNFIYFNTNQTKTSLTRYVRRGTNDMLGSENQAVVVRRAVDSANGDGTFKFIVTYTIQDI